MKSKILHTYIFVAITFLIVSGCVSNNAFASQAAKTVTPNLIPPAQPRVVSVTPSPQPILESTPWQYSPYYPTLQPDAEGHMLELLQSRDCKLPCYLGISPGRATLIEAQAILSSLHAFQYGTLDGSYGYRLNIGDPAIILSPPSDALVYSSIDLILESPKGVVQSINVNVSTDPYVLPTAQDTYRNYWSRYSVSGVFSELGKPNQLYAGIDYDKIHNSELIVVYENLGVIFRFRGSSKENNLCTINENQYIHVTMDLFDPTSGIAIEDFNLGLGPPYWPPINEALGIDVDEFYERVLADPSVCFEPIVTSP